RTLRSPRLKSPLLDGEDCIISPAVKDEDIAANFPKGHRRVKPYLRYTPQPNR
ncbi:MAG: grx, partial [Pedosphaera sp.]|nr:grx [Pedosphaera sp.]